MTMSSIGLPAFNGFVGEILILQGVYVVSKVWAAVAASGIVLGAAYMLWLYQRTMFGKIEHPANANLKDLSFREFVTFAPLIALAVWIGIYPDADAAEDRARGEPRGHAGQRRQYGPALAKAADGRGRAASPRRRRVGAPSGPPDHASVPELPETPLAAAPASGTY